MKRITFVLLATLALIWLGGCGQQSPQPAPPASSARPAREHSPPPAEGTPSEPSTGETPPALEGAPTAPATTEPSAEMPEAPLPTLLPPAEPAIPADSAPAAETQSQ